VQSGVRESRRKVISVSSRFWPAFRAIQTVEDSRFRILTGRLDALSPLAVLGRGFSIARKLPDYTVISKLSHIREGQNLEVVVIDGVITCLVRSKTPQKPGSPPTQLTLDE